MDGIPILYEDDQLLVCVKPRGVLSAKDASGKPAVTDGLPCAVFPVHRLDREATGLMVFAKTAACAAFLSEAMGKTVRKEYLAVCEGRPDESGELTDLLYHDRGKNKTYVVKRKRNGVREARLSYEVLRSESGTSLLHVLLHTGRTHQIRVQLASRGFPLCGDRKYGAKTGGDLQLYAWRLTFPHPDGRRLSFTLPEPFCPGKEF
ncbi:MAG: RluA family pseudouridine synthase [Oscillospiraceae bacterium]|nr:RluA family pseudouridine synthase [Oscillospiraceae bacterium]